MTGFSEEPRANYSARMDKAAFFAWLQTREGRYELKDGEIIMHAGSTLQHAWLSSRFLYALLSRLDTDIWMVLVADFAIEIGDDIRYPDVVVDRVHDNPRSMSTSTPILAIEVLSASSTSRDMRDKLAEYTSLPSLEAYIVASQDEPIVWVWQRDPETRGFPTRPLEIVGLDGFIDITALGVSLPLGDIYRGIAGA